jgi:hypothetical protein
MARLFFTEKEADLFSDLTKEIIKDVIGQKIYYYHVREDLSNPHALYEESIEKTFDPPIEIDCLVEWQVADVKLTNFGYEQTKNITVFLHPRDLKDKDLSINEGDFFQFGEYFFEATTIIVEKIMFGQTERIAGYKMQGKQARINLINKRLNGPVSDMYIDESATQKVFEQQRGFEKTLSGIETGDIRQLRKDGILEEPITGQKQVKPQSSKINTNTIKSSFYGEGD